MSKKTKDMLLRVPADLAVALENVKFYEGENATELLLQGLAIRLHLSGNPKLSAILERAGYLRRRTPGRPAARGGEHANGSAPVSPEGSPGNLPEASPADWALQ